jgi:hypothetical protein
MKLRKTIAAAGLAVAAMTGLASAAPTVIYICGSTAYRAPVTCAILNALGGTSSYAAGNQGSGVNITKAQTGILANGTVHYTSGTFDGTATIIVETNWTGSLAGCVDVSLQNSALNFVDSTNAGIDASMGQTTSTSPFTNLSNLPTLVTSGAGQNTITHAPQVAMSDAFQGSAAAALSGATLTSPIGSYSTIAQVIAQVKTAPLVEAGSTYVYSPNSASGYLGIVPFEWVLGDTGMIGKPIDNITQETAAFLIKKGSAPLTMFSLAGQGLAPATYASQFAYLIGRNEDSGTRIDGFAEPQLGFTTNPIQFLLTFSNPSVVTSDLPTPTDFTQIGKAGNVVETISKWPASAVLNTEKNITWGLTGHGGYAGGGDVAAVLAATVDEAGIGSPDNSLLAQNSGNVFFIGYLGTADAGGVGSTSISGATALTYNGVACSSSNIQSGAYSFWSYEHMYYLNSGTGAITDSTTLNFVNNLADSVAQTYAPYDNGGASAPTTDGAGVFLPKNTTAGTTGTVTRTQEGGVYSLNY